MRKALPAILVVVWCGTSVCYLSLADDTPKEKLSSDRQSTRKKTTDKKEAVAVRPDNLVPLYRFYDTIRNEHVYTHSEDEADTWRGIKTVNEHLIVGDVSSVELPDTIRLWRAVRASDGKHYHYTRAPGKAVQLTVEDRVFNCYVWKKPGEGRVPVYSTTWTDGTDAFFDTDLAGVRKFRDDSKKALGTIRPAFIGRDFSTPAFYVYPHPTEETPSPAKEDTPKPSSEG